MSFFGKVFLSYFTLLSLYEFRPCPAQDDLIRTIADFGPIELSEFEDIGNQEVIYVSIPSAYASNFIVEWTGAVVQTGSGISVNCPAARAVVLMQERSIPVANPLGSSSPPNVLFHDGLTEGQFVIRPGDLNETYAMVFENDNVNSDIDYYMSIFLDGRTDDSVQLDGFSKECVYLARISVRALSEMTVDIANINSVSFVDSLNSSSIDADFHLERYRRSLLNTHYKTKREGYNLKPNSNLRFTWMLEPFSDVGGTLKLAIGVKDEGDSPLSNFVMHGCVMWGPDFTRTRNCSNGQSLEINISHKGGEITSSTWHWPFPRSDLWVLDVSLECISADCRDQANSTVFLDANIVQCIESCHSDKFQGDCKLYRTDVLLFTACDCKSGWAGVACTDGTNAVPYSKQLLSILLLTLSNIIFLPCGVLAIMRGFYTEAIVYFFVMFFSTFYHACDQPYSLFLCIMKYDTLQFTDFLGSVSAIWFTLIAMANLPQRVESWFHAAGLLAISVAVDYNRFSIYTTLIPTLCALAILAFKWGRKCRRNHSCYPSKRVWLLSIIPGGICAIIGFALFAFVETSNNYFYVHSMWHILMGTAVLFLMPKQRKCVQSQVGQDSIESTSCNQYFINVPDSSSQSGFSTPTA